MKDCNFYALRKNTYVNTVKGYNTIRDKKIYQAIGIFHHLRPNFTGFIVSAL